jgi:GTP cyclohydrolase IA
LDQNKEKKHMENYKLLLKDLGENPGREGILKTPKRYLESMKFLTSGYKTDIAEVIKGSIFEEPYQDMVIVRNIEIYSLCEHHMLPFYGRAHVGYIPNGRLIGLSKIPRIVDVFSRRLQVQERLTHQISSALFKHLRPLGVGVVIEAYHLCMMMRGVEKQQSFTMTSSMVGAFRRPETRNEFLSLIRAERP